MDIRNAVDSKGAYLNDAAQDAKSGGPFVDFSRMEQ